MHQAQIRDALGREGIQAIRERRLFAPVLATFMLALPHALRHASASEGTRWRVVITGEAGGEWLAVRTSGQWVLDAPAADGEAPATATATLDEDSAWKLWTRGLAPDAAMQTMQARGDARLATTLRDMVTFIG